MTGLVPGGRRRAVLRLGILVVFVTAAAVSALVVPLPSVAGIRGYFGSVGVWGPAAFILGYAVLTLAPLPKSVLSIAAGLVFGFVGGIAVVFCLRYVGLSRCFLVGPLAGPGSGGEIHRGAGGEN